MEDNFWCKSRFRCRTHHTGGHFEAECKTFHQDYNRTLRDEFVQQNVQVIDDEFAQECLRIHNHFRAQHGCPPLHLSVEVSRFSQEWADRIAREDHLCHSHHPRYGENLFVTYLSDNSLPMTRGSEVVESWYSEHKYYPFSGYVTRETVQKTGHFTQVVWSNSRELGVGKAVSKSNRVYVVTNYYPAGNVMNKFAKNVPERIFGSCGRHFYSDRLFTKSTRFYFDSWIEC